MSTAEWTPAMQAWLEEAMSRSRPLSVRQLDLIRPLISEAAADGRAAA
jgi:hypothetical protein